MFKSSFLIIPSIVLSQTMDSEYCNWLNSNINTDGEYSLGWADCEQTCIVMTRDAGCDIANYGGGDCWCQFGSDQGEDDNGWYHSCFLDEHCDTNGYDCETEECGDDSGDHSGSWSSSSDSEDGYIDLDGETYYDYVYLQEFENDYCSGYVTFDMEFPKNQCTCNFDQGWCVYPLYSSVNIVEVNFYMGYDCSDNNNAELNQQVHLNSCMEGTLLTGHHYDDYNPVVAIISSIFSLIFCIAFVCLFRYCCCPNCHRGYLSPQVVVNQVAQPHPQVQMVPMQQPQVQMVNGQMVPMQQPQVQMVNGQMVQMQPQVPLQQLPNYAASSAPSGEVVQPAYQNYPNLNSAPQSAV